MTNKTINNVPRELLERVLYLMDNYIGTTHAEEDELLALLSAPSPAGAGGLEVIGWYTDDHLNDKSATTYSREVADRWLAKGWTVTGIANADDAKAIIDGLRGEVAELQSMITNLSRAGIRMRTERDQLAGLLREKFPRIDPHHPLPLSEVDHCCEYVLHKDRERLHSAIDAALSEVDK